MTDPWFAPLRERARPILDVSREKSAAALASFTAAGGPELLGVR